MWCCRRMEKISCTDHVRNEDVLLRVKEQRNILHEIRKRKANWIGHILRRNCLLQRVIEGNIQGAIEVTGRQGRRRRKLPDDLQERRGYSHLKEEALDRTMWRDRFGRSFGPVVRQTTKWMKLDRSTTLLPATMALPPLYYHLFPGLLTSEIKRMSLNEAVKLSYFKFSRQWILLGDFLGVAFWRLRCQLPAQLPEVLTFFLWRCNPTRVMASSFLRFSRSHTTTHHSR